MIPRPDKDTYYLNIALEVSKRGTCLRRIFGAVIVNHDQIISTGYNGAPRGRKNCLDIGHCSREKANIPAGERYELCRSVHAEANAIIHASREEMIGGSLYINGTNYATGETVEGCEPCKMCKRLIINAGLKTVIARQKPDLIKIYPVSDWIEHEEIDYTSNRISGY